MNFEFFSKILNTICLFKTWLKLLDSNELVSFQGYYLLRCDRVDKVGDSMALYIANFLHAKILHQSEGKFCG